MQNDGRTFKLHLTEPLGRSSTISFATALTIEISSEAIRQPDIGELFLANRNELAMALTAVIERGVTDGAFRNDLEPSEVALLVIDVIDGCAYRSVLSEIPMRNLLDDAKDFVFAAVRKG